MKLSAASVSGALRVEKAVCTFKMMQGCWGMLCTLAILTSVLFIPCTGSTLHSHMAGLFPLPQRLGLSSPNSYPWHSSKCSKDFPISIWKSFRILKTGCDLGADLWVHECWPCCKCTSVTPKSAPKSQPVSKQKWGSLWGMRYLKAEASISCPPKDWGRNWLFQCLFLV